MHPRFSCSVVTHHIITRLRLLSCVGQHFAMNEQRTILAMIYKRFRLRLSGPAPEVEPHVVLRPKGGLRMTVERR
jgi:cytochrome P450